MKFDWIREHNEEFPIAAMCKVLQVSDSGYYGHLNHKPSALQQRRQTIAQAVARFYLTVSVFTVSASSMRIYGRQI